MIEPTILICPYYIVNSDDEKDQVLKIFNRTAIAKLDYKYPYVIGKEGGFVFQSEIREHKDYLDERENRIYRYEKRDLQ